MIFRVFSRLLDQGKSWYALNDCLCAKVPRKFNTCHLFQLFPHDVCQINIADLQDANGVPVLNQWFNKLDAKKSTEQVYVGSTFAVVAGNLTLKNPSVSEFLRSKAFLSLKSAINKHKLEIVESNQDSQQSGDSLNYFDEGPDNKGGETPQEQESKMAKSWESPESPLNCSTPRRESLPKFESVFHNSCGDSAESDQSGLSISSLLNGSYVHLIKKERSDERWMLSWKALRLFAQSKEKHWVILLSKAAYISVKLKRPSMKRISFVRFLVKSHGSSGFERRLTS